MACDSVPWDLKLLAPLIAVSGRLLILETSSSDHGGKAATADGRKSGYLGGGYREVAERVSGVVDFRVLSLGVIVEFLGFPFCPVFASEVLFLFPFKTFHLDRFFYGFGASPLGVQERGAVLAL